MIGGDAGLSCCVGGLGGYSYNNSNLNFGYTNGENNSHGYVIVTKL